MTTTYDATELKRLLPALYLLRDARPDGSPGPVAALVEVVAEQLEVLLEDLAQSADDHFVETCAEWVVPYLGDLVGVVLPRTAPAGGGRAYVANAVAYRRRKGTAAVLEQLARDVTGWDARAVEFFEYVATTQRLAHPRPHHRAFADLRDALALEGVGTAFDPLPRSADVRRVASRRGRHNVPNVGIFVWRLGARPVTNAPAVRVDAKRYRLSPLGDDVALVTRPETEATIEHLAGPENVPLPLSRRRLDATLARHYAPAGGLRIVVGDLADPGAVVPADRVRVCDLSDWSNAPTDAGVVALDPVLGRVALADDPGTARVHASFHVAAAGRIGGGEYPRPETGDPDETVVRVGNQPRPPGTAPNDAATVTAGLAMLPATGGVVEIADSGRYEETPAVTVADGASVTIRAATGRGPVLALGGDLVATGGADAELTLDGLRVTGGAVRVAGAFDAVTLRHCTLVPGIALAPDRTPARPDAPSLVVEVDGPAPGSDDVPVTHVTVDHCVTGPLLFPRGEARLAVSDSVVDAPRRRAPGSVVPVLVSASLAAYAPPATAMPRVLVRLGDLGETEATLASVPATAADAATELEAALRAAGGAAAYRGARVVLVDDRLVVVPGAPVPVSFAAAGGDPTAAALGLLPPDAYAAVATRGATLAADSGTLGAARAMDVLAGTEAPRRAALGGDPADADAAASALRDAIRAAGTEQLYAGALVTVLDGALLVVPGAAGGLALTEAPDDAETLAALRLATPRHAISGDLHGIRTGPPARLDAVTVVGRVFVREAELVSNTLCTAPFVALRRQVGCVRFSLVPPGSRTPRRHECAPPEVRADFTSLRFGDPGYAQLRQGCPDAVRRGADDGSELGAFHELGEALLEDDLRARLDEFLRFSLEAGVFDEGPGVRG